jgi:hypothetical protein
MIAVALVVIIGVVAVTCGIVADSNHADTLTFLGLMVKTTAAQIFLAGAICTWALFASMWLLSVGIRRSKERGLELRLLKAVRRSRLSGAVAVTDSAMGTDVSHLAGLSPTTGPGNRADDQGMSASISFGAVGRADKTDADAIDAVGRADKTDADAIDAAHEGGSTDSADSADPADSEPTIDFDDYLDDSNALGRHRDVGDFSRVDDLGSPSALDHVRAVAEPGLGRHAESGRFYRANPRPNSAD